MKREPREIEPWDSSLIEIRLQPARRHSTEENTLDAFNIVRGEGMSAKPPHEHKREVQDEPCSPQDNRPPDECRPPPYSRKSGPHESRNGRISFGRAPKGAH